MTPGRAVCVFCGSQPGARPAYLQAARELGAQLCRQVTVELDDVQRRAAFE